MTDEMRSAVAAFRAAEAERADRVWATIVPPRFAGARLTDLDPVLHDPIAEWAESGTGNLLLLGPVGAGKTHAACAAAYDRFSRGDSVIFRSVIRLLDDLRPEHGEFVDAVTVAGVCDVDLLVLDDLAGEKGSDWTRERLDLIVDDRWLNARPIILTSNYPIDRLRTILDPRVYSRLVDDATAYNVVGDDRRRA